MSEYIERNEVLKAMDTWDKFGYTHTGAFIRNPYTEDYVPYVHYEDMVKCVSNFPTADVKEVVRCKDCQWYEIYQLKKDGTDDRRYKPSYCVNLSYRTQPDWSCADGERTGEEVTK